VPAISVATEIGVPAARYANDFLSGGNAANNPSRFHVCASQAGRKVSGQHRQRQGGTEARL